MKKNYFTNKQLFVLKHFIYLFFAFITFIQTSNSQCKTPVVGCANTDLTNFGVDANNNAATIEYDNFISTFHTTIVRTSDGSLQTWGETIANNGTANVLAPLTINATNFPALGTATVLKAAMGSYSSNTVQGIILATDGLYAWSKRGSVLDASITSSAVFQKIAIGGNANGLPPGVVPGDVKMMFGTYKTLAITTCSGAVWVISQTASVRGDGGSGDSLNWSRVTTDEPGNPFLSDVVVCRGSYDGLMALKSDGTVYVWGANVLLGDNSAIITTQNRAIQMTLPVGITPKMIGSTGTSALRSYYVLATDNNLYGLGENSSKQLGDWTTADRLSWVQPRYTSTTGPVMDDIKWFSSQEHDIQYGAINVINTSKMLYAFGQNNGSLLGVTTTTSNPSTPTGIIAGDNILAVETGGHTSMIVKKCDANFGYVGHRINGSMGDGTNASTTEVGYNFATAPVQICGVQSQPIIEQASTGGPAVTLFCAGSSILLAPTPVGGTLSIISGPGNLVGNTLNFTGSGIVKVEYSVATDCGGTTVTVRDFTAEDCANLSIVKSVNNATPRVGSTITFSLTAKNLGLATATGVSVNDVLPTGYEFVSATTATGTYNNATSIWTIGSLSNGSTVTLDIKVKVKPTGNYLNTAIISSTQKDPDPSDNEDTETITPLQRSKLITNPMIYQKVK